MTTFAITRVYADTNGESLFEDLELPMTDNGSIGYLSDKIAVDGLIFREVEPSYDYDFHCAPERQFIVLLDGRIEIETSCGEKREFGAGEVLLVEDTTGKGHRTRNLLPEKRRSLFIRFE
jgi:hypothetical protein